LNFSEYLNANVANIKDAVSFSSDGTTFAALGANDTVVISGNTLVVTFDTAITDNNNKIAVAANSLKDAANNVLTTQVTTSAIQPNVGSMSLTINPATQSTGSNVTATADSSNFANPTYQFWVKSSRDDTWTYSGDYSTINSYTFTEQVPGTYTVMAFAKAAEAPYSSALQSDQVTVEFTKDNTVCALTVTGPNGAQPIGSSATFTATAADHGGTPMYQFWVHDTTGWRTVQDYSTNNTYTMSDLQLGSYTVAVYALDVDDIAAGRWDMPYYKTFVLNIGSSVTLDAPSSVAVGGTVNLTAQAVGLTGVEYQFWYQTPDLIWHGSDYSTNNSFSFTASSSGAYVVAVYAKDHYAPNTDQFALFDSATIN
jgi:cell wall-associated protease